MQSPSIIRIALSFSLDHGYHRSIAKAALNRIKEVENVEPLIFNSQPNHPVERLHHLLGEFAAVVGYFSGTHFVHNPWLKDQPGVTVANTTVQDGWGGVHSDDREIGIVAAQELQRRGVKHIACVGNWAGVAQKRAHGVRVFCEDSGLSFSTFEPEGLTINQEDAPSLNKRLGLWLRQLPKDTGIFCFNDRVGNLVINLLQQSGKSVPGDYLVIGVDNDEMQNELLDSQLTSVEPDTHSIGRASVDLVLRLLEGEDQESVRLTIPPLRVVRRSSTDMQFHSDPVVREVIRRIDSSPERAWKVEDLCRGTGVSRRAAEGRFRQALGHGIYEAVLRKRIDRGKDLLRDTMLPISQIAERLEFCDQRQFGVAFRRFTKTTPSAYRGTRSYTKRTV